MRKKLFLVLLLLGSTTLPPMGRTALAAAAPEQDLERPKIPGEAPVVLTADERRVIKERGDYMPQLIQSLSERRYKDFQDYYGQATSRQTMQRMSRVFQEWAIKDAAGRFLYKEETDPYSPRNVYGTYKRQWLDLLLWGFSRDRGLVAMALSDRVVLQLDGEQTDGLLSAAYAISEELRQLPDSLLTDSASTPAVPELRYWDARTQQALLRNDSVLYQHFVDLDHEAALNILSQKQFRRVVHHSYPLLVADRDRIWNLLDSANMTYDLDPDVALYRIQNYLLDLRVVEETFWNDRPARVEGRHKVKVYAPAVIKRYFSLRPKKPAAQPQQEQESSNKVNYLW